MFISTGKCRECGNIKELPKGSSFIKWDRKFEDTLLLSKHNGSNCSCLVSKRVRKSNLCLDFIAAVHLKVRMLSFCGRSGVYS